jgi:uncharacterized protein YjbI with pentapeptide repeats
MKSIFAALLLASSVHAACIDPAGPGVNWSGCRVEDSLALSGKVLPGANFNQSLSRFVNVDGADISRGSSVGGKHILLSARGTNLRGFDFTDSVIYIPDFTNADLRGSTFTRASLIEPKLTGALLAGAKWLDGSKVCAAGSVGVCK